MNGTKEKILDTALTLFSRNGYDGTSMSDIAGAMGLTKPALYKHFGSKEEIWDTLIGEAEAYYADRFGSAEHLPETPSSPEAFTELVMRLVTFTVRDGKIVRVRKMLTLGQYRDARTRSLATQHFLTGTRDIFAALFRSMMENGLFKKDDPVMLAFAFTAPVSALVCLADREPEKETEALETVRAFTEHFIRRYGERS